MNSAGKVWKGRTHVGRIFASGVVLVGAVVAAFAGSAAYGAGTGISISKANCIAEATAAVSRARKPIPLAIPKTPVSTKAIRGKDVWWISPAQAIPFVAAISNGFKEAATAAGLKPHIFDGKGSVTAWNQGVTTAVGQGADAIVLQGIDPRVVSGPLAQAKKRGIPVIDSFTTGRFDKTAPGVSAHVTGDFRSDGKLMADYVLADTKCDANIVTLGSSVFAVHLLINEGITAELKRLCPDCKYKFENIDASKIATTVGPTTQNALRRDPSVNYMIADFDGVATYMVPAIQQLNSDVPVVGHDGVAANLNYIRNDQVQVADFAFPPTAWIGWAEVDQIARLLAGKSPAAQDWIPSQLVDKVNIAQPGKSQFPAYKNYKAQYKKLWK
jgi:ribose transport system substrate-binding protein